LKGEEAVSDLDDLKLEEENSLSLRVRTLCQIYSGSAENVGSDEFSDDEDMHQYDKQRYEKGARKHWK
jgi:hypothetical protein